MSLEVICQCCGSPCAAFTSNAHFRRMCMECFHLSRKGAVDARVHKALGVLRKCHLDIGEIVFKLTLAGVKDAESRVPQLKMRTHALIRHDKILTGPRDSCGLYRQESMP